MNVFDYIEKELDRIEVGYTSHDGTRLIMTIDDVRELVENLRIKLAQNLSNACTDTIYRQVAIDAVCAVCGNDCDKSEFVYNVPQDEQVILCPEHYVLCTLPFAQPDHIAESNKKVTSSCGHENDDLISRQAAISLAGDLQIHDDEYHMYNQAINNYCTEIMGLPPAQPWSQWIPCSERLPDENYVLISRKPTKLSGSKWCVTIAIRTADPRSGKIYWRDIGFGVIRDNEVLAWLPLPEPYMGE